VRRTALASLLLAAACSGTPTPTAVGTATPASSPSASASPTASPTARLSAPAPTASRTATPAVRRTAGPTPTRSATPAPKETTTTAPPLCPRVPDVGPATQVVLVDSSGSAATVRACERRSGQWVSVLGRMSGHVGYRGVAPPGQKREGDRRTPGGTFRLGRGFGVNADPGGTWFSWRRVTREDVWVDDPGSDLYNTWQELPANGRWDSAESLYQPLDYAYAQVVDYNTARVPGRGSAIFLHVDDGNPTLGCITLSRHRLIEVFRWQRPGTVIVIR